MGDEVSTVEVIDEEHDAEVIRKMALAQALFKAIKEEVGTGDPGNLRGEFDAIMAERFEKARALGVAPKSFDVEIDGEKVGTYGITYGAPESERTRMRLVTENRAALLAWAVEHGYASVDVKAVERHFEETGEVPDGCRAALEVVTASKGGIKRTSLRIDPPKVSHALGASVGESVAWLLEGGE